MEKLRTGALSQQTGWPTPTGFEGGGGEGAAKLLHKSWRLARWTYSNGGKSVIAPIPKPGDPNPAQQEAHSAAEHRGKGVRIGLAAAFITRWR
jgi:hypothetical protein